MTLFKSLMRLFTAALVSTFVELVPKLLAFLSGTAPSDISPMLWAVIGIIGAFGLNYLVAEYGPKPPVA